MWYQNLLSALLVKIKPEEREKAQIFLNQIFQYLEYLHQPEQVKYEAFLKELNQLIDRRIPLPPQAIHWLLNQHFKDQKTLTVFECSAMLNEISDRHGFDFSQYIQGILASQYELKTPLAFELILGIVQHMYAKYERCTNNSVGFLPFAQDLFSLSLLYSKATQDRFAVNNSQFHIFFNSAGRLEVLELSMGALPNDINLKMKSLEATKLKQLNYSTAIHFNFILGIVYRQKSPALVDSMTSFFNLSRVCSFPYIVERNDHFVKFVLNLHRVKYQIEHECHLSLLAAQNAYSLFSGNYFSRKMEQPLVQKPQVSPTTTSGFFSRDLFANERSELLKGNNFVSNKSHPTY